MSITSSPERPDLSESVKLRPQGDNRDFVAMFGLADEPMAGKRPPKRSDCEATPLAHGATGDAEPVA